MEVLSQMKSPNLESLIDTEIKIHDNLDEALEDGIHNDKLLLVYFYDKSQNPEGDKFINVLTDQENNTLFQENFCIFISNIENDHWIDKFKTYNKDKELPQDLRNIIFTFNVKRQKYFENATKIHTNEILENEIAYQLYLNVEELQEIQWKDIDKLVEECATSYLNNDKWTVMKNTYKYVPINKAIDICINQPLPQLKKVLIIYMYKEGSVLTNSFNNLLKNGILRKYNRLLVPVFWDISDSMYHNALKSICDKYFDEDVLKQTVTSSQGGIFFFMPDEGTINITPKIFCTVLESEGYLQNMEATIENIFTYFQDLFNITDLLELKAINRSRKSSKIIKNFMKNSHYSLHDAIQVCLQLPQKMLLLNFSTKDKKLFDKLEKFKDIYLPHNTLFLSWDVTDPLLNQTLSNSLERAFGLQKLELILKAKIGALFIFVPVGKIMTLYSVIDENTSVKKMIEIYKEANTFFTMETELADYDEDCGPGAYQQVMYKQIGDRDFDCFKLDQEQGDQLRDKIGFAYYGPPLNENGYSNSQQKEIKKAFDKIKSVASKYGENPNTLYVSFMRICITPLPKEKQKKFLKENDYQPCLDFGIVPLFGIRKCFDCPKNSSACQIYIDHCGRVYQSWGDFLENNLYPEVMIIAPKNGKYTGDYRNCVQLEICPSPACGIGPAILKGFDIGLSVVGGVAGATAIAASALAVPVVAIAAVGVGIGVGVYSIVRSSMVLADRGKYCQTLSLRSPAARGAYFNIVAGSLGFSGAGATFALAYMARTGATIGLTTRVIVNSITIANLTANGVAIGNSAIDVICQLTNNGSVNPLALVQLTSAILFFGHAVYSAQSASTIITRAQNATISEILDSLSSKTDKETLLNLFSSTADDTQNVQTAYAQVIKYLRNLDNLPDVVSILTKNAELMNENGIKYTIKGEKLLFNGVEVDIQNFNSLSKIGKTEMLAKIPVLSDQQPKTSVHETNTTIAKVEKLQILDTLTQCAKIASNADLDAKAKLQQMLFQFTPYIQEILIKILKKLLKKMELDDNMIYKSIESLYPSVKSSLIVMKIIIQFYFTEGVQEFVPERVRSKVNNILKLVEQAIVYSNSTIVVLLEKLITYCSKWVVQVIVDRGNNTLNTDIDIVRELKNCDKCNGKFYA